MTTNTKKTFTADIQSEGGFIFVELPFSPREVWGAQARFHVAGAIDGHPVTGTLGTSGQARFEFSWPQRLSTLV